MGDPEDRRPRFDGKAAPPSASFVPPAPEMEPSRPAYIWAQLEQPTESNPGGTIAEGYERHTDRMVRVYAVGGALIGGAPLQPGEDATRVATRILREKLAAAPDFYRPLPRFH